MTNDEAGGLSAKARRKLDKHASRVMQWLADLPDGRTRQFFLTAELIRGTGLQASQLGPALRALGWRYAQRRIPELMNTPAAVWAPPWMPDPRRPRGRPAASSTASPGGTHDR